MSRRQSKLKHQTILQRRKKLRGAIKAAIVAMTICSLGQVAQLQAQDNVWIGGTSTDYHNAANWSLGVVPVDPQTVVIDNDGGNNADVRITSTGVAAGALTIGTGDKLTIGNSRSFTFNGLGGPTLLQNDGELFINSTGSTTSLILNQQTLLTGVGVLRMNSAAVVTGNGSELNQNAGHTIAGNGSLGNNSISIVNDGTIVADSSVLVVDPNSSGLTNNGVMRADGGQLRLDGFGGGTFVNNGSIEAADGSQVQLRNAAALSGGTLSSSGTGSIQVQTGNASIENLTNNANLVVENSRTLSTDGSITNNGTIRVATTGSTTTVFANSNTTFAGTGTVLLEGSSSGIQSSGNVLTNADTHTISGTGNIGNNNTALVNQSLISANINGQTLNVDPSSMSGMINSGTMEATNGGILRMTGFGGGVFQNSGLIAAEDTSQVRLEDAAEVVGGNLSTTGTGEFRIGSGGALLDGLTLNGNLTVENARSLSTRNTIENNGIIKTGSTGSVTAISLADNTDLIGTGTVRLQNSAAAINGTAGTHLLNGSSHTVAGHGSIGANQIAITNDGTITADTGTLNVDPDAAGLINNGTMNSAGGGTLLLNGFGSGSFTNNGSIQAGDLSTVRLENAASISGGIISSTGSGQFRIGTGDGSIQDLTSNSSILIENARRLNVAGNIANNGTIETSSVGSATDVFLTDNANFDGTGTIKLQNSAASVRGTAGMQMYQGANHVTEGFGNVGFNQISIYNDGTITADQGQLNIDPESAAGLTNNGLMQANSGATLRLDGFGGGQFQNFGTILANDGGSVLLESAASVNGGLLQSNGSGSFLVGSGDASISNLTNNSQMSIGNLRTLSTNGTIVNNGLVQTTSVGSATSVDIATDTIFDGTGNIRLQNSSARVTGSNTTFTQTATHSLFGYGQLGANNITIHNDGLIDADTVGTLNVDPDAGGLTNSGMMQASNGGTLQLNGNGGGVFSNSGIISAQDASVVSLVNGANVIGGNLESSGSGYFTVGGGNATLDSVTSGAYVNIENSRSLITRGSIENNGNIQTNSVGSTTSVFADTDTAFSGVGTLRLQNSSSRLDGNSGVQLTNAADHTIAGHGNVGVNNLGILNYGTISADVSGTTLTLDPNSSLNMFNLGTLRAENGGNVLFTGSGGGSFGGNGRVQAFDGSSVVFNPSSNVSNVVGSNLTLGTWEAYDTGNGALIDFQQSAADLNSIDSFVSVTLSGANAEIRANGHSLSQTLTSNSGELNLAAQHVMTSSSFTNMGYLNIDGTGTQLAADDFQQVFGETTLTNGGSLALVNGADFQAGLLAGNGTLYGDAILETGSTISPGQSSGILDIVGDADFLGTIQMEIAGNLVDGMSQDSLLVNRGTDFSLSQFDQINVLGNVNLDGTMDLSFIDGYQLNGNAFFDVLTADSLTLGSSFALVDNTGANFTYSVERLTDSVSGGQRDVLRLNGFSAVPEPSSFLIIGGLAGAIAIRRRKRS